jgi:DnaJ-class molecular chaperone
VGQYRFNGHPEQIYARFFDGCGDLRLDREDYNVTEIGSMFRGPPDGIEPIEKTRQPDLIVKIPCTIAELYNGCIKSVAYEREVLNPSNCVTTHKMEESRDVVIHRGYGKQTRLTYKNEGHESPNFEASDLIFEITEVEDATFKRCGDDLVYIKDLSLLEALEAPSMTIRALDDRELSLSID